MLISSIFSFSHNDFKMFFFFFRVVKSPDCAVKSKVVYGCFEYNYYQTLPLSSTEWYKLKRVHFGNVIWRKSFRIERLCVFSPHFRVVVQVINVNGYLGPCRDVVTINRYRLRGLPRYKEYGAV